MRTADAAGVRSARVEESTTFHCKKRAREGPGLAALSAGWESFQGLHLRPGLLEFPKRVSNRTAVSGGSSCLAWGLPHREERPASKTSEVKLPWLTNSGRSR